VEGRPGLAMQGPGARPGQGAAARELLAPVYGWFTEGFDMRD